ncbi:two-component regulator propeller domain-containing protein [Winogradskyella sp. A3E31]|uniref:type IX secretion system anionic LPS delivery protein PorZ n=1 Tax=Winogradskyella sp. A3E31 TaxID=3349637 RepID=UPI00398B7AA9
MLKKVILVFTILFFALQPVDCQDFSTLWQGHFSYNSVIDITKSDSKLYAASENAIFSYDFFTEDIETITTVEGLSGDFISTIEYSQTYQLLLIGYTSGLVEIYFENDCSILSVVDILDKVTIDPALKAINDFNEHEGLVYIATDFGISVYDLQRIEFGDTYFIGSGGSQIPVEKTTVFNNAIYAACTMNNGLKKADVNSTNLVDFQEWQTIATGDFLSIEQSEGRLYALRANRDLLEVVNDVLVTQLNFSSLPVNTEVSDNNLAYTTTSNVYIYNSDLALQVQVSPLEDYPTQFTASITDKDDLYIGTKDYGVLKTSITNPVEFQEILPDGPLLNDGFKLNAFNSKVWVTFGEYDQFYNPFPLNSRGISRLDDEGWRNIPFDSLLTARCLADITVNPSDPNQTFISSYHDGLLEFNDIEAIKLFNNTNSPLQSLILPGNPDFVSIRVGGTIFDREGKLWSITSRVDEALKSYDPASGQWQTFSFEDLIEDALVDELGFPELVIDNNNTKFVAAYDSGLIAYNENLQNPLRSIRSREQGFPSRSVRALALDRSNQLWIGTDFGLRVLFNTGNFFDDPDPSVEQIIFLEDGIPRELLEGQFVTDIKIDGSNNKWLGTGDSGVFYVTPNGQNTIYHFTKDNSPLPSNAINDITIDESNGTVYFATPNGLVSFRAGGSQPQEELADAYVYPNPVRPDYNILGFDNLNDITKGVKIVGLTENVNIKITDIEGNLVAEAQSRVNQRNSNLGYNFAIDGGTGIWNGKNMGNNIVASGVYLVLISDLDSFETKVLKLLIIR